MYKLKRHYPISIGVYFNIKTITQKVESDDN